MLDFLNAFGWTIVTHAVVFIAGWVCMPWISSQIKAIRDKM